MKLYAARDKKSGKIVKLTTRTNGYYVRKNDCRKAMNDYYSHSYRYGDYNLELVTFELHEVEDEE